MPTQRSFRLRFSIRTILCLFIPLSLGLALVVRELEQAYQQHQLIDAVTRSGGAVGYEYRHSARFYGSTPQESSVRHFLRSIFGDSFARVRFVDFGEFTTVEHTSRLTDSVVDVDFKAATISSAMMDNIAKRPWIRGIGFTDCRVTEEQLRDTVRLPQLERITLKSNSIHGKIPVRVLDGSRVRVAVLGFGRLDCQELANVLNSVPAHRIELHNVYLEHAQHLSRLLVPTARSLYISDTDLSDVGIEWLIDWPSIETIDIVNCNVQIDATTLNTIRAKASVRLQQK